MSKTCSRWRSRARFTSGLYSIENSGRWVFSPGEIRPNVDVSVSTAGTVSEALSDMLGMELDVDKLDVPPEPALSIGRRPWNIRRQNEADVKVVAAENFRLVEGAVGVGPESLRGTNLFLQLSQRFFRSFSSSS